MESFIRKIVWLFRENKAFKYAATALAVVIVSGGVIMVVSRTRRLLQSQSSPMMLDRKSGFVLRQMIISAHRRAIERKALQPLATSERFVIEQSGIPFLISVLEATASSQKKGPPKNKNADAFATITSDLHIGDLSDTHTMVLNKFPVIDSHTVVITKDFLPQDMGMSVLDIQAIWTLVSRVSGLGFFNCGKASGSSQPRRHMQFIPFEAIHRNYPETMSAWRKSMDIPLDMAIRGDRQLRNYVHLPGQAFTMDVLPFRHAACMIGGDLLTSTIETAAPRLHAFYMDLLKTLFGDAGDMPAADDEVVQNIREAAKVFTPTATGIADIPAHNLLITPGWMFVVPRTSDEWNGVPINAMAFAGFMLSKPELVTAIREAGPLQVLQATTGLPSATYDV